MTRTLIPEAIVGSVACVIFWYLFPVIVTAQYTLTQVPNEQNMSLIIASIMLALGAYALIAVYCYAAIVERIGYFCYESIKSYLEYRRREYL
jgi:xanthine/uracil permease